VRAELFGSLGGRDVSSGGRRRWATLVARRADERAHVSTRRRSGARPAAARALVRCRAKAAPRGRGTATRSRGVHLGAVRGEVAGALPLPGRALVDVAVDHAAAEPRARSPGRRTRRGHIMTNTLGPPSSISVLSSVEPLS